MQKIYRVWAENEKTPNPIKETHLPEEVVVMIVEQFPYANYFFMED